MLQLYPVYLLWNRHKTLTGSPDPKHMQTVQINLAMSKEPVSKWEWNRNIPAKISKDRVMEVCRVQYNKAVSIEIIQHLLGGPNMEYNSIMEIENSIDCYHCCKTDFVDNIKENKKELMFFEERQNSTSTILITIVKQERTNAKHEHIILNAVIQMTLNLTP